MQPFDEAMLFVLLGAEADSPPATRPTAGAGSEVAAQNVGSFCVLGGFWAAAQSLVILSNLRPVCTFFYDPHKNCTRRPTRENG